MVTASAGQSVNDGMLRPASAADPEAHDKIWIWSRTRDVNKSLEARSPSGHWGATRQRSKAWSLPRGFLNAEGDVAVNAGSPKTPQPGGGPSKVG